MEIVALFIACVALGAAVGTAVRPSYRGRTYTTPVLPKGYSKSPRYDMPNGTQRYPTAEEIVEAEVRRMQREQEKAEWEKAEREEAIRRHRGLPPSREVNIAALVQDEQAWADNLKEKEQP